MKKINVLVFPGKKETGGIPGGNRNRDAAFDLAHYVVNTAYKDLPNEIVEMTKRCILDTLGVTIAASTLDPWQRSCGPRQRRGWQEESTILSFGGKAPVGWPHLLMAQWTHVDYET